MSPLAIILGGWGVLKRAISALLSVFARWPRECIIAVLVCAVAWLLLVTVPGKNAKIDRLNGEIAAVVQASNEAAEKAKAAKLAAEQAYKDKANEADKAYDAALADARDATSRYIASHRVPKAACGASGGPVATSNSSGTEGGIGSSPAPELVAVSEADIHICTTNTTRLEAVRDWASTLNK